jgi:hypothetical protein
MTKNQMPNTKEAPMTVKRAGSFVTGSFRIAVNRAEDQVQLASLAPECADFIFVALFCRGHHPQKELGFAGFFAADGNLEAKIFPGDRLVGFTVIGANARGGTD